MRHKVAHKIAVGVEYDGARYHGWQRQRHTRLTVQAQVEAAVSRVADARTAVYCAGRTDRGVHALGQVAHFETAAARDAHEWVRGANRHLPDDIRLRWACEVADDFHARFTARRRGYRYIIDNTPTHRGALSRYRAAWVYRPLDEGRMAAAARCLTDKHDFSAFRGADCQAKSPVKTVYRVAARRQGPLVVMEIEADAFLQHMVRNIVGTLIPIGAGDREPGWCREVLESRDRKTAGPTAPAAGLYLTAVVYPDEYNIPAPAPGPVVI